MCAGDDSKNIPIELDFILQHLVDTVLLIFKRFECPFKHIKIEGSFHHSLPAPNLGAEDGRVLLPHNAVAKLTGSFFSPFLVAREDNHLR